jgi:IS5 family transposase
MRQRTFSTLGFEVHSKQTRRQRFLTEMDAIVPWRKLCRLIKPHYPKGHRCRPPIGIDRMLRIYFLQVWFNLSDPGVEDALYDSAAMRGFVDIDLGREPAPDETTICKFRHLVEANGLGEVLFEAVTAHLSAKGIKVGTGSIMDATIIAAPSSTKNEDGKRDPEMHQTKKGNQWYFGLKAHIGVDSNAKIVHPVAATAANVHDSRVIDDILHGNETRVWGDSACQGQQREAILKAAPHAKDFTHHRGNRASALSDVEVSKNRTKSRVRAYVEHPFRILKCVFGFRKVCYRGIAKNLNRLQISFALINLYMKRRTLMRYVMA